MQYEPEQGPQSSGSPGNRTEGDPSDVERLREDLCERERELRQLSAKLDEQLRYRARLNRFFSQQKKDLQKATAEVEMLRGSVAFRLGTLLVGVARHPRRLLRLPLDFISLVREVWPRIRKRLGRGAAHSADAPDLGPEFLVDTAQADLPAPDEKVIQRMLVGTDSAPTLPDDVRSTRIATIMDEFSFAAFRHCGDLRQIRADTWREEIAAFAPHMLIVESAWKGKDETWARKVYPLSHDLIELVAWCRERRIPTVFWNKEDPVHLSVFMRTARQFDFVFTTDIDCVRTYKATLGHGQVYWLPFACQPVEHNPIEEYQRKDGFCFAGSFYAKYPERQRDFATLVNTMAEFRPVEIYDRNADKDDPALAYPGEYAPMIQGVLPHDRISLAYKGYRYGININTVKQSQSMFARRAFDLLANNTVTVSNFSRGLRMLLGELVISSDDAQQLGDRVKPLLEDDVQYRRFRLAGLRKVMSEHTYQDRLRYIFEKVGGRSTPDDLPNIVMVARAEDGPSAERVCAMFAAQQYAKAELLLVMDTADAEQVSARPGITIVDEQVASRIDVASRWPGSWLGVLHPEDHYGRNYLTDLALATRYSTTSVVGKAAYYAYTGDLPELRYADRAYRLDETVQWRRAIVRCADVPIDDVATLAREGASIKFTGACSIDEFNYCAGAAGYCVDGVDDIQDLWTGLSLHRLHRLAETATAADVLAAEQSGSRAVDATALAGILPVGKHADGAVKLAEEAGKLRLESRLSSDAHVYLYAARPLPIDQLFEESIGKFNLVVETEMLLSFVLIFLDASGKRIGHAIRACSSNLSISAPSGTRNVRIGLRVQGSGTGLIKRLVLGHVPSPAAGVPSKGRHLLVSRGYPSYEHLYSYAYVHRRMMGYAEDGASVDVFRLAEDHIAFAEFEGVDVVSGQLADLELMIRSNPYRTLMAHSLDRALWSVLKEHAADRQILVWVHGAEIQPWYRRDFSFIDARDRERGIQRSNDRMAFWRDLFSAPPANVKFVFVSRHLAREAFRDVGLELDPSRYVVIHNHVDGDLFAHVPKSPGQRLRILSIRPYSRPTYANDLTVKAILDLVGEPFFPELEFRLVGDGRLFDETVEPVRHLPNVLLDQRFLDQREIAALHKDYGVFLAPTRIDSQGVSRDEAMASGLVPITNRVSAVPEFVDESCAFLADPEDWRGMADAVRRLHAEPETFLEMSTAAAERVRMQSGRRDTLDREIALMDAEPMEEGAEPPVPSRRMRIALYGDLDLNLIDGSAIWAASLARVIADGDLVDVDLFLKAPVKQTEVIRELLGMVNVRLVEPPPGTVRRQPGEALDSIIAEDVNRQYDAVILRGFDLAHDAVSRPALAGRLWIYLTDVPQRREEMTPDQAQRLAAIADGAALLLCQTSQLEQHLVSVAPGATGKTRLLPPMVPDQTGDERAPATAESGAFRLAYAGKFAPLWGIRELFHAVRELRAEGLPIELHVFGDKIHNPPDDPTFKPEIQANLESGDGVVWHRGLDRSAVLQQLKGMHVGWAWRSPGLEESTLELSTKLLEYAGSGAPPLLAPGPVNRALFGEDYPLFATASEVIDLLRTLVENPGMLEKVRRGTDGIAADFTFKSVRERFIAPLLTAGKLH